MHVKVHIYLRMCAHMCMHTYICINACTRAHTHSGTFEVGAEATRFQPHDRFTFHNSNRLPRYEVSSGNVVPAQWNSPHSSRSLAGPASTCSARPPPVKSHTVCGTPCVDQVEPSCVWPWPPPPVCQPGHPLLCVARGTGSVLCRSTRPRAGGTGAFTRVWRPH